MTDSTGRPGALARPPYQLGDMPLGTAMKTTDQRLVHAPVQLIFDIVRKVELGLATSRTIAACASGNGPATAAVW